MERCVLRREVWIEERSERREWTVEEKREEEEEGVSSVRGTRAAGIHGRAYEGGSKSRSGMYAL